MIRSVDILVRDSAGRTWLQMRDGAARTAPLCWGFWGGALEAKDATIQQCAARELAEELSVDVSPSDFTQVAEREGRDGQVAPLLLLRRTLEWTDICIGEGAGAGRFWRPEMQSLPLTRAVAWHLGHMPHLFARSQ